MSKSATTLQVDRDAREVFTLAAIAVSKDDGAAALDVCRRILALDEHYRLALRVGDDAPAEHRETIRPGRQATSTLRRFDAKFPGRCAKCAQGISVGTPIAYDANAKRVFHDGCAP